MRRRQRENRPGPGPDHLFPLNQDWIRMRGQLARAAPTAGAWVCLPPAAEFYPPGGAPWLTVGRHTVRPTWAADV